MATTFTKIASLSTYGVAFYEFTSIPATFTDLMLITSVRTDRPSPAIQETFQLQFNSTNSNRSTRRIYVATSTAGTDTDTSMHGGGASAAINTANCFGSSTLYITNYTTTKAKMSFATGGSQSNGTGKFLDVVVNQWNDTATITTIRLTPQNGGIIQQYSSADLYGIKNS